MTVNNSLNEKAAHLASNFVSNASKKLCGYLVCFLAGYALSKLLSTINQLAVKRLGLPIDTHNGKDYQKFAETNLNYQREIASKVGCSLDRQMGVVFGDIAISSIREEIFYRFLLERYVLPFFSPSFQKFSLLRTSISSALFSLNHLQVPIKPQPLRALLLNTAILGVVCSIAREKFGLLGSIFLHLGFNLDAYQYMFNQKASEVFTKIRSIHIGDLLLPEKVALFIAGFLRDAVFPFILAYRGGYKLGEASRKLLIHTAQ